MALVNRKSRKGLLLAVESAAALICTILAFRVLAMPLKGLPPQLIKMVWPLLALELGMCALGIFLFFRHRNRV